MTDKPQWERHSADEEPPPKRPSLVAACVASKGRDVRRIVTGDGAEQYGRFVMEFCCPAPIKQGSSDVTAQIHVCFSCT